MPQKGLAFRSKESVCVGVARLKTLRGRAYAPTIEVDPGLASVRGLDWPGPHRHERLALQLPFLKVSESMDNHDSEMVGAGSVD